MHDLLHSLLSLAITKLKEKEEDYEIETLKYKHVHDIEGGARYINPQPGWILLIIVFNHFYSCNDELDCLEQTTYQIEDRQSLPQVQIGAQAMSFANVF